MQTANATSRGTAEKHSACLPGGRRPHDLDTLGQMNSVDHMHLAPVGRIEMSAHIAQRENHAR